MRITSTALIAAAALVASIPDAAAQTPQAPPAAQLLSDIVIQRGFAELIEIPGTIDQFIIGNPGIIDAVPVTSNTFLMNGLEQGTTNIIVIDANANQLYRARVHVRPVQIWPGYSMKVTYGTGLAHAYVCDRESGCPPRPPRPAPTLPPVTYVFEGNTTINNSATAGAGAVSAPAPAGQSAPTAAD